MITLPVYKEFDTAQKLAKVLAAKIAGQLQEAIDARGKAALVVSGGSTPLMLFSELSRQAIDWQDVYITLADERWVSPEHADSNERLVREHLLVRRAAKAKFRGLKNIYSVVDEGVGMTEEVLSNLPRPFDVVVLGMGNDGHTASLFPCSEQLQLGLTTGRTCLAVHPTTAPHGRLSLSLKAILDSKQIYLHLHGDPKREVLRQVLTSDDATEMPIRAVLNQRHTPVDVYWSQAS
ncbi:6-phosphogluconolactonase [Ferrimonas sediminicola]|uniref:6-phosphogluconolactonase n=1 Tax=Ferrimonas sediminicola TaxID=2569538 RepID=A0A4U1BCU8_9GAMM|nr:6-phosphogluconolactonase [Ferrimonas sediminicola]TKB48527.1 6-phosphogluconolactonase [Ferrimonas sediminicola]